MKRYPEDIPFKEMDEELLNNMLKHYFLPPAAIAKGNVQLVLQDTDNMEHRERLRLALDAIHRIEKIVHNMVETGKIWE